MKFTELMNAGPEEKLKLTEYAQPAIFTKSYVILCKLCLA